MTGVTDATRRGAYRRVVSSSFVPREHGAYALFFFPLATALASARPTWAAVALAFACTCAFAAQRPLLSLVGIRSCPARGPAAKLVLLLGALALASSALALRGARPVVALALLVPLAGGAALVLAFARRSDRTTLGALVAAVALPQAAFPVALAAGRPLATSLACWWTWSLAFAVATTAVHAVIETRRGRGAPHATGTLLAAASALALVALASALGLAPRGAPLALLPLVALGVAFALRPPHPRRLRAIGWSLAGACTATGALLVAALA